MRVRAYLLMAASLCASCATSSSRHSSAAEQQVDLPIPAKFQAEISRAEGIGRQLYELDKVSSIATDTLIERVPNFRDAGVAGYLPAREASGDGRPKDSFLVAFFTKDDPPLIAYEVRVGRAAPPEFAAFSPPKAGTESFVTLVRARQSAIAALPKVHQPINPILVPGGANNDAGILVYLLAGTTKPGMVVFGQHFRVLMPEHGTVPKYVMPLSKSVLEVPINGGPNGALVVTHLVSDCPLETHVLVSLQTHLPIYVVTRVGLWRVDGDKIALIDERSPTGAK